jgi:uncharacterized protein YjbJ (UPF0337 family)
MSRLLREQRGSPEATSVLGIAALSVTPVGTGFPNLSNCPLAARLAHAVQFHCRGIDEDHFPCRMSACFSTRSKIMITTQELRGHWNELKGKVKEKWGQMTDDDFAYAGGNVDQLVGRIQQKTGQARSEIEKFFKNFSSDGSNGGHFMENASHYMNQAAETVREGAHQAAGYAREGFEQVRHASQEGFHQAEAMVRKYPGSALALAFGAGLICGMMCASSSRSHWF